MSRDVKQIIVVRKDLNMRKGKIASQVAHASMQFLIDNAERISATNLSISLSEDEADWLYNVHKKIVVGVDSLGELDELIFRAKLDSIQTHVVTDLGYTEFNGVETVTCAAFGPCEASILDELFGHLKLI